MSYSHDRERSKAPRVKPSAVVAGRLYQPVGSPGASPAKAKATAPQMGSKLFAQPDLLLRVALGNHLAERVGFEPTRPA
jgi:hypothetical protein